MHQILLFMSGSWKPAKNSKLNFSRLAVTGTNTGTISYQELMTAAANAGSEPGRYYNTGEPYVVAAHITGKVTSDDDLYLSSKEKAKADGETHRRTGKSATPPRTGRKPKRRMPSPARKKSRPISMSCWCPTSTGSRRSSFNCARQATTRTCWSTGNSRTCRSCSTFSTCWPTTTASYRSASALVRTASSTQIEEETDEYRKTAIDEQSKLLDDAKKQIGSRPKRNSARRSPSWKAARISTRAHAQRILKSEQIDQERIRDVKISALQNEARTKIKQSERELAAQIRGVQDKYKFLAFLLPPIPPILLACFRVLPPPQGRTRRRRHPPPALRPRETGDGSRTEKVY